MFLKISFYVGRIRIQIRNPVFFIQFYSIFIGFKSPGSTEGAGLNNFYCTRYNVHCSVFNMHYTAQCTLYSIHCTVYTVHFALYDVRSTQLYLHHSKLCCILTYLATYILLSKFTVECWHFRSEINESLSRGSPLRLCTQNLKYSSWEE